MICLSFSYMWSYKPILYNICRSSHLYYSPRNYKDEDGHSSYVCWASCNVNGKFLLFLWHQSVWFFFISRKTYILVMNSNEIEIRFLRLQFQKAVIRVLQGPFSWTTSQWGNVLCVSFMKQTPGNSRYRISIISAENFSPNSVQSIQSICFFISLVKLCMLHIYILSSMI